MADEKQTTSDIDDWLEDLDDSDEFSAELDQDNIDALLSGDSDDQSVGMDLSADDEDDELSTELDQDNIDALLGGMSDSPVEKEASAQEPKESDELDQDNIDALLGGMPGRPVEKEPSAQEPEESDELDQDNIDALFGGMSDSPVEKEPSPQEPEKSEELDQDNIDLLLGGDSDDDGPGSELDQANIDSLLGGFEDDEKPDDTSPDAFFVDSQEGTSLDVDQDEIDQLFSGLDDDDDGSFGSDDMDIADVLGRDDDFLDLGDEYGVDETAADLLGAAATAGIASGMASDKSEQTVKDEGKPGEKKGIFPFLPESINKTVASVIAACLVLVIGFGLFFFLPGGEEEAAVPVLVADGDEKDDSLETPGEQVVQNTVPNVADSSYQMPEVGGEVTTLLAGSDIDGDNITFEVVKNPQYGRLSGEKPSLVYLPNNDFPGQDSFQYVASDGKGVSRTASVVITGPNLQQIAELDKKEKAPGEEEKSFAPRGQTVAAKSMVFKTKSTDEVIINWDKIWREANNSPFNSKVYIDVDKSGVSGSLTRMSTDVSKYSPDPFFDGQEFLYYRFKSGGLSSDRGKLVIDVELGSPAPQIRITEMAKQYKVGQTVYIDASSTRDEARETLEFFWEQVGGVPVPVDKINAEGSAISFNMPSTFYTEDDPGPVIRVTAVDETGKSDTRDIKVRTVSLRPTALWRGSRRGVASDPPLDRRRLPWPYYD